MASLHESTTSLPPGDVIAAAKRFFAARNSVYTAFVERESPHHVVLRGQGGEEIVFAARDRDGVTLVTGSSYLFDQQVMRFLASLPPAGTSAIAS
jgi:hypothetical protein